MGSKITAGQGQVEKKLLGNRPGQESSLRLWYLSGAPSTPLGKQATPELLT